MGLSLTVLGCSGTYAAAGGACSGYLLQTPSTSVWLDCGPGTLANLHQHVDPATLDAVVVSHSHPDHMGELPVYQNACKYFLGRSDVPIHAPQEVRDLVGSFPSRGVDAFEWRIAGDGQTVRVGDMELTFSRTDHPVETLAVRVDHDGVALGYSADTGPAWSPSALGRLDVLLGEATYYSADAGSNVHMTAHEMGGVARESGIGGLIVTHVPPTSVPELHRAEAEEAFGAPVELAEVGKRFDIASRGLRPST